MPRRLVSGTVRHHSGPGIRVTPDWLTSAEARPPGEFAQYRRGSAAEDIGKASFGDAGRDPPGNTATVRAIALRVAAAARDRLGQFADRAGRSRRYWCVVSTWRGSQ